MMLFKKDAELFSRFSLELWANNHALKDVKTIGVDMEVATFNGLKVQNLQLKRLICVRQSISKLR